MKQRFLFLMILIFLVFISASFFVLQKYSGSSYLSYIPGFSPGGQSAGQLGNP